MATVFLLLLLLFIDYQSNRSPLIARLVTTKMAYASPLPQTTYPICTQPPLSISITSLDETDLDYKIYLPIISKAPSPPSCTVYCGFSIEDDPYRPTGYQTYFADEFNCDQLLDYWIVQQQITVASYTPPASGYVEVSNGTLKIGVPGLDTSFPYLYIVDDSATTYDVPHTTSRVDWLPIGSSSRLILTTPPIPLA